MSLYLGSKLLSGVATDTISNAHSLLDFKWTDHILNEMSWLRADTFSWHNGLLYKAAYNHLVADLGTIEEETLYGFIDRFGDILYTKSSQPSVGDVIYDSSGNTTLYTVESSEGYTGGWIINGSWTRTDGDTSNDITNQSDTTSSGAIRQTETIGSYTITYWLATDGHKICTPDQEATVQNIYNESGVAWYYILDTTNQRFKLPRIDPSKEALLLTAPTTTSSTANNYAPVSLYWNVAGSSTRAYGDANGAVNGKRMIGINQDGNTQQVVGYQFANTYAGSLVAPRNLVTNLSSATSIYKGKKYLYFYVGNYTQTAVEQTAGLNSELFNGKLDLDVGNATSSTKQTIVGWGIPDYDSAVSLSAPTTSYQDYTATKPCMIELLCFYMAGVLTYKINNHEYNIGGNTTSQQQVGCLMHIYLGTGDVLSYKTQCTNYGTTIVNRATMFPLKGV